MVAMIVFDSFVYFMYFFCYAEQSANCSSFKNYLGYFISAFADLMAFAFFLRTLTSFATSAGLYIFFNCVFHNF